MKNIAIIQARMSSRRLPGKVLADLCGRPMLLQQIERVRRSQKIDHLMVATSDHVSDDPIESVCANENIDVYRGSLDDVLARYISAADDYLLKAKQPSNQRLNIIRLTADCPLIDSELIDHILKVHDENNNDYTSNNIVPSFPDGLDVEVVSYEILSKINKSASIKSHREHVTLYIKDNQHLFKVGNVVNDVDLSMCRWTVDEPEDLEFVRHIYEHFGNCDFSMKDIEAYIINNPELQKINHHIGRDEGLLKSRYIDTLLASKHCSLSHQAQATAKLLIAGESQLLSKRPDQFCDSVWPSYFSRAKGASVWDLDGNQYIDMSIGGIGATVLGYADDDVDNAVIASIKSGVASSLNCTEEIELAEKLCRLHPWADKARFARTGGEAMAIAVRIARAASGKDKVAFCGYHGWHDWYLAANLSHGDNLNGHLLPGLSPIGVPKALAGTALPFKYNDLLSLETILKDNQGEIAAIVMEPIRNIVPKDDFLLGVRRLADQYEVVLVIDEISAGFRMANGGAHLSLGLEPDIAVFSKALANGYAMAAVIGKAKYMNAVNETFISSTNWTERVGPTAALATLNKIEANNVPQRLMDNGKKIQDIWRSLADKHDINITVYGLYPISGFSFDYSDSQAIKSLFVQLMLGQNILATTAYYAMYSHDEQMIEKYQSAADLAFGAIAYCIKNNNVYDYLQGSPAANGFKRMT
ncbi:aminotransferase class III-fold pyridoxal phosphate-dependent enzyme [Dasania sp. GY-MA-18]|uniref:Aminotransferase class III-fold pyridoxal phosphate-dependent enzyme n=1 Tax=Dasania phycosphaerae TaxID=2950436 RepID=A0A9J6RGN0_9GAMM|nr:MULTISPECIES: aminotransferase class III-fold pyridoxal phosphate-dependent enzyme [Dasania]MCR8921378.1 aminotransferase class III-fold pyridoxal phosphate-dependent enzyme [Dasania sp. GY-MA-18]MCZ0863806.1 aminotransferase class III-fold pyridoxal phosphate-dependent enzyme [Dasania phycosphaerae]MCZ0867534.1 aminotransferase class III-fold pyridoxal phosphate-dependent enzyme [Dasania phycosphaerae]